MKAIKPILWHQGLFLQPQHFQYNDSYIQSLLNPLMTYLQPYMWGVCNISIGEAVLNNQIFEIEEGQFIFQDGTWVTFPGNAFIQSRSFKDHWKESDKPLKVYLGLHKWNHAGENVTILKNSDETISNESRYIADINPEEIKDMYQKSAPAQIKFMNYDLKIFWESEMEGLSDYHLIPIAELENDGKDFKLSRDYIPPSISISSSNILYRQIKTIKEQVTTRCRVLSEYKIGKITQATDLEASYIVSFLSLMSLNRHLPALHQVTEVPVFHPYNAYCIIRQLIGELSSYTDRVDAMGRLRDGTELLSEYNHENLGRSFSEAMLLISELLEALSLAAENIINLIRENDYFSAEIPSNMFEARNAFYLIVKTSRNLDDMEAMINNVAKISSAEQMPTLIKRALPGVRIEKMDTPPPGLPRRPDVMIFRFDRSNTSWMEIQKDCNICMCWSEAPEDVTAEIAIIKRG
ncbi:MAG: type VI secretion system baseplate subunit TssK [Smithella sp.]